MKKQIETYEPLLDPPFPLFLINSQCFQLSIQTEGDRAGRQAEAHRHKLQNVRSYELYILRPTS